MQSKLLLSLIGILSAIIIVLGIKIYIQRQRILGTSINPIPKNSLLFPKNDSYKYFYEPEPNTIQNLDPQLISELGYPTDTKIRYTINSDGLNQISNYSINKPDGVYRIVTLGDSFTYGQNVNTEDNYPAQLENLLNLTSKCKNINKFEVINLGVGGYDVPYSIERYKLRGQKYNPDLVLWFIIGEDLYRLDEEQIPKSQAYEAQEKATGEYDKLIKKGIFYKSWGDAQEEILREVGGKDAMLKLQLNNLNNISNLYKGSLLVFSFPNNENRVINTLKEFVNNRKDTYYYDDLPNIYENSEFYLPDSHPNAKGYTEIVDSLYDYLTKNNIIPCERL